MGKTYKDQKDNKVNHAGWDFTSKRLGDTLLIILLIRKRLLEKNVCSIKNLYLKKFPTYRI